MVVGVLGLIWFWLLCRAVMAEYQYYRAVRSLLPEVWQSLGAPSRFAVPWVFVSPQASKSLKSIENEVVLGLARRHHQTGREFLLFIVLTLVFSIVWFKFLGV